MDMATENALEVMRVDAVEVCEYCQHEMEVSGCHGGCPNCGSRFSCGD